jgi:hypothetical protein
MTLDEIMSIIEEYGEDSVTVPRVTKSFSDCKVISNAEKKHIQATVH